jgi:hypothetical protein
MLILGRRQLAMKQDTPHIIYHIQLALFMSSHLRPKSKHWVHHLRVVYYFRLVPPLPETIAET